MMRGTSVLLLVVVVVLGVEGERKNLKDWKRPEGFDAAKFIRERHPEGKHLQEKKEVRQLKEGEKREKRQFDNPFRVAFVFVGPLNDLGWSYQHNQGRVQMEIDFEGEVQTEPYPSVEDTYEASLPLFTDLAENGNYDMIVGTTFGYQWAMVDVATEYKNIYFLHISGYIPGPNNWATAFGRIYQARYLTGLVAGYMTDSGRVGSILAIPIPEVYRGANAMYKGVIDANDDLKKKVTMSWTYEWVNHDLELYQADLHMNQWGVKMMTQDTDTFEPQFLANQLGYPSIGYNVDAMRQVSISVLASATWNWGNLYNRFVERAMDGTWEYEDFWGGMDTGIPLLSDFSPLVPNRIQRIVDERREEIIDGDFQVFCGKWIEPWWNGEGKPDDNDCLTDFELLVEHTTLHPDIDDRGFIPIPLTRVDLSDGVTIAMQIIAAICLLLVLISACLTIFWRKKNAIHYSSFPFLLCSLFGVAIVISAVFMLSAVPTDGLCSGVVWVVSIGTTIFFVPLLAKTYRIVYIYHQAAHFKKRTLQTHELVGSVMACLLVDIIILICFQTIDSPEAEREFDDDLDKYEYRVVCDYPGASSICIYIMLGWKALLLLSGVIVTFLVRNTSKTFNESKHLSLAIYDCTFVFAVLIPLIAVLDDVEAEYLLACLGLSLGISAAYLVLFLPKFFVIATGNDDSLSRGATTSASQFNSHGSVTMDH